MIAIACLQSCSKKGLRHHGFVHQIDLVIFCVVVESTFRTIVQGASRQQGRHALQRHAFRGIPVASPHRYLEKHSISTLRDLCLQHEKLVMMKCKGEQTCTSRFLRPNGARRLAANRVAAPRCKPAPSACKTLVHHPLGPVLSRRKVCEDDRKIFLFFPLKSYHLQTFAKYFAILANSTVSGAIVKRRLLA